MTVADRRPQVVLVRHGETEWSAAGRHTGRTDVPLTEEGRRQAQALGRCLQDWTFQLVLASPLARASDTCRLAGLGGVMQLRDDLREWDYGEYEGRTTRDIRAERPGWTLWTDGVPGGETADHIARRADRVIAEIRAQRGDTALFAHGHVLRVLAARWLALPPDRGRNFVLETATISVLGYERETPAIGRWNLRCD
jgi:probable phosphoglycerate mutase